MPPGAPWWAFLIPAGVEVVKEIVKAVAGSPKESVRRAKAKKEAKDRQKTTDYNIPQNENQ